MPTRYDKEFKQNIIKLPFFLRSKNRILTIAQYVFQPAQDALRCILGWISGRRGALLLNLVLRLSGARIFVVRRHARLADVDIRVGLFYHHSSRLATRGWS